MSDETPIEEPVEPPVEVAPEPEAPPPPKKRGWLGRLVLWLLLLTVVLPVGCTAVYAVVPPPVTILMVQRLFQGQGLSRDWVPVRKVSPRLAYAVIAAEDARFCEHQGFDIEAMKKALRHNERRPGRIRGGSTVSQQTAKNVFLWPARSYVRKGLEAYYTVLIEALWGKRRIMEVYLNTVEWGPGIYGAQAAARANFDVDAEDLTSQQAARLAAILPSPLKWKAAKPGPYVQRRARRIAAAAGTVRQAGLADCLRLTGVKPEKAPKAERRKAAEQVMEQTAPPPVLEAPPLELPPLPVEPEAPAPAPEEGVPPAPVEETSP